MGQLAVVRVYSIAVFVIIADGLFLLSPWRVLWGHVGEAFSVTIAVGRRGREHPSKLLGLIVKEFTLYRKNIQKKKKRKSIIAFIYIYILYIQGVSSLRSLTPFTPACNTM